MKKDQMTKTEIRALLAYNAALKSRDPKRISAAKRRAVMAIEALK